MNLMRSYGVRLCPFLVVSQLILGRRFRLRRSLFGRCPTLKFEQVVPDRSLKKVQFLQKMKVLFLCVLHLVSSVATVCVVQDLVSQSPVPMPVRQVENQIQQPIESQSAHGRLLHWRNTSLLRNHLAVPNWEWVVSAYVVVL